VRLRRRLARDDARGSTGTFDVVVANILCNVLVAFARDLVRRLAPLLGDRRPEIYERDEWRAAAWRSRP
jgi:ribosomal protein L11 methylase PrmA